MRFGGGVPGVRTIKRQLNHTVHNGFYSAKYSGYYRYITWSGHEYCAGLIVGSLRRTRECQVSSRWQSMVTVIHNRCLMTPFEFSSRRNFCDALRRQTSCINVISVIELGTNNNIGFHPPSPQQFYTYSVFEVRKILESLRRKNQFIGKFLCWFNNACIQYPT